jgi:hypothetical protein
MARRRSSAEWEELLKLYAERDCSQEQFCERQEITSSTLNYHLAKASYSPRGFSPVVNVVKERSAEVVVYFPGGVCLSVRG